VAEQFVHSCKYFNGLQYASLPLIFLQGGVAEKTTEGIPGIVLVPHLNPFYVTYVEPCWAMARFTDGNANHAVFQFSLLRVVLLASHQLLSETSHRRAPPMRRGWLWN